jgi:hypothetical protein
MTSLSNFPKKRGRPLGSRNKRYKRPAMKKAKDTVTFKQPDINPLKLDKKEHEAVLLRERSDRLVEICTLKTKILNLEHQAIGYRAVISYLEHQFITTLGKPK